MKLHSSNKFRYRLVQFLHAERTGFQAAMMRALLFVAGCLTAVPFKVTREVVFGQRGTQPDLKSSVRILIWLGNRSWIPFRHPMGTFFDLGWYLSRPACKAIERRGFLSKDVIGRRCDLAQLRLSRIRECLEVGDAAALKEADRDVMDHVGAVLTLGWRWAQQARTSAQTKAESEPSLRESPPSAEQRGFDNPDSRAALLDLDDVCRSLGQEYFLVSGTFLGAVRDGAFIGHDHDIDVGIEAAKLSDGLLGALQDSDAFRVRKVERIFRRATSAEGVRYKELEAPGIIRLAHSSGVAIDIFIHFPEDSVLWHGTSVQRWDNLAFELKPYAFLDREFLGAADFDRYLTENYGPDWRTPKLDFNTNFDTPNISFVGTANALVWFCWAVKTAVAEENPERARKFVEMLRSHGVLRIEGDTIRVI